MSKDIYVMKGEITFFPKGLNLDMYKFVLRDPRMLTGYGNTLLYAVVGTAISLLITSLGAYALSKKEMPFFKSFTLMIVFTMFFNGGMIPTFLVVKSYGLIDSLWGMVLPAAVSTWNLLVMRTFYTGVPIELEESGKLDGLNELGIFFRIVMPLSKAIFATIGLFYAVAMWNNFTLPLLYLRDPDLFPLQVVLRNIVLAGQLNSADATSIGGDSVIVEESLKYATIMVATLPILTVYPFLQKYFVKGVMVGAIKG
ncbi:carbohydrate ABC transporter permease [Paenibacillus sp. MBLB4367]|uniref:carbohydrate ABC transporter permease n=1 Tax=Paenibacillus sp. MBLB4367 TaxID=3384767 RepID=UPI0039081076